MSKVFVTQQNLTRDAGGAMRPRFDLSPAAEYGELAYIFGAGQVALEPEAMIDGIEQRLSELKYAPGEDFLLATGDMVIGMMTFHSMMIRGPTQVLRWDGRYRRYNVIQLEDSDP